VVGSEQKPDPALVNKRRDKGFTSVTEEEGMNTPMLAALLICVLSLMVAGCSSYYRVTDPISGKTYYTTDIDGRTGGVKFKDDRTRATVILHSAEVSEISEEEYGAELKGTGLIVMPPPVAIRSSARTETASH
jgi:hypothetical protein